MPGASRSRRPRRPCWRRLTVAAGSARSRPAAARQLSVSRAARAPPANARPLLARCPSRRTPPCQLGGRPFCLAPVDRAHRQLRHSGRNDCYRGKQRSDAEQADHRHPSRSNTAAIVPAPAALVRLTVEGRRATREDRPAFYDRINPSSSLAAQAIAWSAERPCTTCCAIILVIVACANICVAIGTGAGAPEIDTMTSPRGG